MKADFINPFLQSTLEVFKESIGLEDIEVGKPSIKYDAVSPGIVTGIIDMRGSPVHGSYAIILSKELVSVVCTQQFARELKAGVDIRFLAKDMAGELCNMVCGRAKALLANQKLMFSLSPPRTFLGAGHRVEHLLKRPVIQIPFASLSGGFFVESNFGEVKSVKKYWHDKPSVKPNLTQATA